jgi:hypothetical protein
MEPEGAGAGREAVRHVPEREGHRHVILGIVSEGHSRIGMREGVQGRDAASGRVGDV